MIIAIVALVVFGPKKIPELGNALGKTLRGFKEELNSDDDEGNAEKARLKPPHRLRTKFTAHPKMRQIRLQEAMPTRLF